MLYTYIAIIIALIILLQMFTITWIGPIKPYDSVQYGGKALIFNTDGIHVYNSDDNFLNYKSSSYILGIG